MLALTYPDYSNSFSKPLLGHRKTFANKVAQLTQQVKAAKKLPGFKEILLPGERGNLVAKQRLQANGIEIEEQLLKALQKSAQKSS